MTKSRYLLIGLTLFLGFKVAQTAKPDEGMWLPIYLKDLNEAEMKKLGLKLNASQIYSVEKPSLKDAIIRLNNGSCTAELVSDKGLLFTNHHCAYNDAWEAIRRKDIDKEKYLAEGFWSQSMEEEIGDLGITAGILSYIANITDDVFPRLEKAKDEQSRAALLEAITDSIENSVEEANPFLDAQVKEMFYGNEYYIYVYKVYKDVRLVAVPPESIGKFGGDTDNWMWPRHTGDFAVLRIYANADNEPANFSEDNKPFAPKWHLPVSLEDRKAGDFSMIMGFPGSTERYLTHHDLETKINYTLPAIVGARTVVLDIMKQYMDQDSELETRLKSFRARLANGWKLWQGQILMAGQYDLVGDQAKEDAALADWVNADPKRKARYLDALEGIKTYNEGMRNITPYNAYYTNGLFMLNTVGIAFQFERAHQRIQGMEADLSEKKKTMDKAAYASYEEGVQAQIDEILQGLSERTTDFYDRSGLSNKNYPNAHPHEYDIMEAMLIKMYREIPENLRPEYLKGMAATNPSDPEKGIKDVLAEYYNESIVMNEASIGKWMEKPKWKKIDTDPFLSLVMAMVTEYRAYPMAQRAIEADLSKHRRRYMEALMTFKSDKEYYPDANSTMRLTYGTVIPYNPRDAVAYDFTTSHKGVLQKTDPEDEEFNTSPRQIQLLKDKKFGPYGDKELTLCFLTNHDITGGNSGSPVINGKGELIGIAFDGNWEAATSDFLVMPDYNRTISVDIRYVLWVIDIYAECDRLIKELDIRKGDDASAVHDPTK